MDELIKILDFQFFIVYSIIQILIIMQTYFTTKRIKNLDANLINNINKIKIQELQVYLSFARWITFVLPFKIGDAVSLFILKKKIIKLYSSSIFYLAGSKFLEFFILLFISFFFFIFFYSKIQLVNYEKIIDKFFYILLILIFFLIFILKKNKIFKIKFKNIYINNLTLLLNSNKFFSYTFLISLNAYFCTILLLFICSDRLVDTKLFFLCFAFTLFNAIPLRLPFNIGVFDIFAGISNQIFNYGLTIENLLLFRILQLFLYSIDFVFWYLIYNFKNRLKN
jgi:hypothetical protein